MGGIYEPCCWIRLPGFTSQHHQLLVAEIWESWGFPGGSVVESPPDHAGGSVSIPGPGGFTCHGIAGPMHHNY